MLALNLGRWLDSAEAINGYCRHRSSLIQPSITRWQFSLQFLVLQQIRIRNHIKKAAMSIRLPDT